MERLFKEKRKCGIVLTLLFVYFNLYMLLSELSGGSPIRVYPNVYLGMKCDSFRKGIIQVKEGDGRLGNIILEYVSIWSFANLYQLDGYISDETIYRLRQLFQVVNLKNISSLNASNCESDTNNNEDITTRLHQIRTLNDTVQLAKQTNRVIMLPAYVILRETIVPFAGQFRLIFKYKHKYEMAAQRALSFFGYKMQMKIKNWKKQVVFVGIHVRRTDFEWYMWKKYGSTGIAGVDFYCRAVAWMRTALYQDARVPVTIAFVVTSDDPKWCYQELIPRLRDGNLSDEQGQFDVFYGGKGGTESAEHDIVLLSSCNHSIFSYGTFGLWSALMAGGRTVMYNINSNESSQFEIVTPFLMFAHDLSNWTALS